MFSASYNKRHTFSFFFLRRWSTLFLFFAWTSRSTAHKFHCSRKQRQWRSETCTLWPPFCFLLFLLSVTVALFFHLTATQFDDCRPSLAAESTGRCRTSGHWDKQSEDPTATEEVARLPLTQGSMWPFRLDTLKAGQKAGQKGRF